MYCSKCGKQIEDGQRFCSSCGTIVGQSRAAEGPAVATPASQYGLGMSLSKVGEASGAASCRKSFDELKKDARKQIKGNILMLLLVGIVWILFNSIVRIPTMINSIVSYINSMKVLYPDMPAIKLPFGSNFISFAANFGFIFTILGYFVMGLMSWGDAALCNQMYKGERAKFSTAFDGFKHFWAAVWTSFLMTLYIALWFMLFIIPGIIKSYSYACTMYIRQESPNKSATECITESREIMNGNKFRLFTYHLYFGLLCLLSVFTLGIALIWIVPYFKQTEYNFYKNIKR
jgi:uncharacterized membrane protein